MGECYQASAGGYPEVPLLWVWGGARVSTYTMVRCDKCGLTAAEGQKTVVRNHFCLRREGRYISINPDLCKECLERLSKEFLSLGAVLAKDFPHLTKGWIW